jgi:hypothetical protein
VQYVPVELNNLTKRILPTGHPHKETSINNPYESGAWPLAMWFFVLSSIGYVAVGMACAFSPPSPRMAAGGREIPPESTCLRVTRHADYITADLGVGTPTKQISLLLRLDSVLPRNSSEPAMRLFAQDTVESTTVSCSIDGQCQDIVVIQMDGPTGEPVRRVAKFNYRHASVEDAHYTTASQLSGVGGELALSQGMAYWITSTHVCYAPAPLTIPTDGMVAASVKGGLLSAERMALLSSSETRSSPVADDTYTDMCVGSNYSEDLDLFPVGAGVEASWLSILDTALYNSEPESVDARRVIAEVGTTCASNSESLSRDLVLYRLDCDPYNTCIETPNMPMRRIATSSIALNIDTNGDVGLWTDYDPTLSGLPRLANSTEAFILSLVKLLMIVLAAAVVYVRAKRATASSSWLFKHCIESATDNNLASEAKNISFSTSEDRLIGALAFTSRGLMVLYRVPSLYMDDQARVCISEMAATILSVIHWTMRYFCISADGEPPISMLGGSTAIIDSTSAVMMAFAEAPTLVVSMGKFDPTARLLTGILISLIVTSRCAFSASCCGVLWESETNRTYKGVLVYSGIMWVCQSVALSVIIVDLFVTPSSYSMSRNVVGSILPARILLFLALVCAGLPRLMATLRHILSAKEHVD